MLLVFSGGIGTRKRIFANLEELVSTNDVDTGIDLFTKFEAQSVERIEIMVTVR
ncbi:MAG: hypothetical protein K0R55_1554 [Sporomusa sp.]|nr:hypothetical protein [Sporomusa sp.]